MNDNCNHSILLCGPNEDSVKKLRLDQWVFHTFTEG